ncbi:MAG: hypothetical protein Ct9H90mP5_11910 [Acidimicrobiaceae bacterium]|nr:MAG: hypothetical protein Ct9H90mP5_11910 [Acidimicrobiaceae bacterium]
MQELNIAWGTISDETKRKQYDQSLIVPEEPLTRFFISRYLGGVHSSRGIN